MIATSQTQTGRALHTLLSGLVDYAGLFPPAGLSMGEAVTNYASYRSGADAWALGRFVTPVARFGKLESAFLALPQQHGEWRVTALLGADIAADFNAVAEFNARLAGRLQVDSVEIKTAVLADIRNIAPYVPAGMTGYCELDLARCEAHLPTVASSGLRAKIRTGGLTEDAFPSAEAIADFLLACARHRVAFKATAGLHHPVRSVRALTYQADAPRAMMHGFLNVFLAAALAWQGASRADILALLAEVSAESFSFDDNSIRWRNLTFTAGDLQTMRSEFAISFGSCSFVEPLEDLRKLNLL